MATFMLPEELLCTGQLTTDNWRLQNYSLTKEQVCIPVQLFLCVKKEERGL